MSGALGFVLAGGLSRRMGCDKALLPWAGGTLLEHAVARLRPLCDEVLLLTGGEPRYASFGLAALLDAWPGAGPLGGLLAGLERLDERPGLFLAADVPAVPGALLGELLRRVDGHAAAVPVTRAGPEPLAAAYTRACLAPVRRRLAAGERKLTCFWPDVDVHVLDDDACAAFGDPREMFTNVNAAEDYERLRRPVTEA